MGIKKYLTIRVIILLAFLLLSILAISPNPFANGIVVKSIEKNSEIFNEGVRANDQILMVNGKEINSMDDYNKILDGVFSDIKERSITIRTDKSEVTYNYTLSLGFKTENLTIIEAEGFTNLTKDEIIKKVGNVEVNDTKLLNQILKTLTNEVKLDIRTDKKPVIYLATEKPRLKLGYAKSTNIKKGLDFEGGTRVLLRPVKTEELVTDREMDDLIKVLSNRLDVYGLGDLKMRPAKSFLSDDKFVLIEIGGVTKDEVSDLIGKQGKFEAKVGDTVVFEGGKKDVVFVCRNDGSCSGITPAQFMDQNTYLTRFQFQIKLSADAAKKQGLTTKNLTVNSSEGGEYLSKNLDLYLDGELIDSLKIGKDLRGNERATDILISGPGYGRTQEESGKEALKSMEKLQTILITGSLPFDIKIEKLDSISPIAGEAFLKNAMFIGLLAFIAVGIVLYLRYRRIMTSLLILMTIFCEIIIILGFAAIIGWSLDLAAIAGIIAAIGTGVDSQIVIVDEIKRGEAKQLNWKQRIKNAFFIIFAAYATVVAAMIPLFNAGAGLVRGFAITTIIGVSIGVFITRPAFSSLMEKILGD